MLPPRIIVTNKKLFWNQIQLLLLPALVIALMAGCTPPGPRALLQGKRLLEEGKYEAALEKLRRAASLMQTNAQAWNYLGLACHHAARAAEAADAYQKALKFNHDLVVVHYNLGCLLLEQNKLDAAQNELTAFTLHQGNSFDGWLKLGTVQLRMSEVAPAQLRTRELGAAEKSFGESLRLNSQDPEALNNLGLVQLQLHRQREALADFNAALKQQPNYGPALLNLATISQVFLKDRPLALRKYREYLALKPRPANWEAVYAAAQQLAWELSPPARPVTNSPAPMATAAPTNTPPHLAAANTNTSTPRPETNLARLEPSSNPPARAASPARPAPPPEPVTQPKVVQLTEAPVVKVAEDVQPAPHAVREPARVEPAAANPPTISNVGVTVNPAAAVKPEKRGFFRKLNPMNLFHHEAKPPSVVEVATPLPPVSTGPAAADSNKIMSVSTNADTVSNFKPLPPKPVLVVRYAYLSPPKPAEGNHAEAERVFAQAVRAQSDHRLQEAVALYRSATQLDPGYFEAQSNLGLAAYESGDMAQSLAAYEIALAIEPASFNARFNFALALKKAGYIEDSAEELERVLTVAAGGESPSRLALAHLTLANLYADQFHQAAPARLHYLKVLELDPKNSQAVSIRYWLRDHSSIN